MYQANQRVLFGAAGGLLVVASALAGTYYVVATRSEARAATAHTPSLDKVAAKPVATTTKAGPVLDALLARTVDVKTGAATAKRTWAELGVEIDADELARTGTIDSDKELASLAQKGSLPVRLDRDKAVKALLSLKEYDKAAVDAYLDLEEHKIYDDSPGQGIDVWASLQRISAAARQAAPTVELASVAVPAHVTKQGLGIEDISNVLGHYETSFAVTDRDRNFNLKLAASHINGVVLKPGEEWSFNKTVGERSQATGYKVAHVITAGEMVDGLAGGTCQISTTLFGAAFFAGLDIVKTTPHSRPSVYTPLGFDSTVVWPNTDLVIKNPYDFPVAVMYRVANGVAKVEILGKKRPWSRIVFARQLLEETPYSTEERLDDEMPKDQTTLDQGGFNGYRLTRFRRFYEGKKMVREQKWTLVYKPVTEYVRRGTNADPAAKMPPEKEIHTPKAPKKEDMNEERVILAQ